MTGYPLFAPDTPVPEATEALLAEGLGDGLPVVPPTEARCAVMRAGAASGGAGPGGPDPDEVLGLVSPLFGELTVAAAAYFAVLAGARPSELPVVLAAVRACLEPEFNLLGVQTTTGTASVVVLVHGAAVTEHGFNTGANLLGPGNRANASVGRAVALTLAGVGGAQPGVTDMATTGQPGRYTFCLPEAPDGPWPGFAARRGVDAGVPGGAVTVLAVGGTSEVLPLGGGETLAEVLDPIAAVFAGAALAAGSRTRMAACEQFVVLPPEVATQLVRLGAGAPEQLAEQLYQRGNAALAHALGSGTGPDGAPEPGGPAVAASAADVHPIVTGGAGVKMLHLPGWIGGSRAVTRPVLADPG